MEILSYAIGIVGILVGTLSWLLPKNNGGRIFKKYTLEIHNTLPIYDPPFQDRTEHFVSVTLRNRSGFPIHVTNWGIVTPSGANIVVYRQPNWGNQIPTWVSARSKITLNAPAGELRSISETEKIPFSKMKPWVELADGTRIKSKKGVPLA